VDIYGLILDRTSLQVDSAVLAIG